MFIFVRYNTWILMCPGTKQRGDWHALDYMFSNSTMQLLFQDWYIITLMKHRWTLKRATAIRSHPQGDHMAPSVKALHTCSAEWSDTTLVLWCVHYFVTVASYILTPCGLQYAGVLHFLHAACYILAYSPCVLFSPFKSKWFTRTKAEHI